jgi:Tfp pilus assembly protein PilX
MTHRPMARLKGDRGSGMVTGLVLMFVFTAGAVVWLARDVDRAISNRSAAQSVAFQAARSGAQQVETSALRTGASTGVVIDDAAARRAAAATAAQLFDSHRLDGKVTSIVVELDRVTVTVEVTDAGRTVTGVGSARAVEVGGS